MIDASNLWALLVLLPGFLAWKVYESLTVRAPRQLLSAVLEILWLDVLVLLAYAGLSQCWPALRFDVQAMKGAVSSPLEWLASIWSVLAVLASLSVFLGTALAGLVNRDAFLTPLRSLGLTKQASGDSVWHAAFRNCPDWVVVHLEDGTRVMGWPTHYADHPDEGAVFLQEASYLGESSEQHVDGPGILITAKSGVRMVEFLHGK